MSPNQFYSLSAKDISGNLVKMEKYKGYVLLISNVASLCGLTDCSYTLFKRLSDIFYDKGLRILLFPSNQFLNQEPGSNESIKQTIDGIGGKFDVFEKIDVYGSNISPLFNYLKTSCPGFIVDTIKWNFTKFLVDHNGNPVARYAPKDNNQDGSIEKEIQRLLSMRNSPKGEN